MAAANRKWYSEAVLHVSDMVVRWLRLSGVHASLILTVTAVSHLFTYLTLIVSAILIAQLYFRNQIYFQKCLGASCITS